MGGKTTKGVFESALNKVLRRLPETWYPDPCRCWIWPGGTKGAKPGMGYGQVAEYGPNGWQRNYAVHRLAWEYFIGPIPPGHALDHLCQNKRCFNPAHLDCVPFEINAFRGNRHQALGLLISPDGQPVPTKQMSLFDLDEDAA